MVVDAFGEQIAHGGQSRSSRYRGRRPFVRVAQSDLVTSLTIPVDLLPSDGRFGCGPAKVRTELGAALAGDRGRAARAPRTARRR